MSKTEFQDGGCGGHLGQFMNPILTRFEFQRSSCCYRVTFGSYRLKVWEEMSKIDFQNGGTCFSYFASTKRPYVPHQISFHLDQSLERRCPNMNSQNFSHINVKGPYKCMRTQMFPYRKKVKRQ